MAIVLNGATSGNVTIDANAISGTSVITLPVGSGTFPLMTLSTAVATTSGTAIDFTNIPTWVKKITVMFNDVSTSGTSPIIIQLGSGSIETTSYKSTASNQSGTVTTSTAGLLITDSSIIATATSTGTSNIILIGSNLWVQSATIANTTSANIRYSAGNKTTSSTLDRIRLTTVNGTDTFDAGSINILMEGY